MPDLPALRFAFSAGITLARPGDTAGSVFNRADRALYQAKGRGRGRHVVSAGEVAIPA